MIRITREVKGAREYMQYLADLRFMGSRCLELRSITEAICQYAMKEKGQLPAPSKSILDMHHPSSLDFRLYLRGLPLSDSILTRLHLYFSTIIALIAELKPEYSTVLRSWPEARLVQLSEYAEARQLRQN